MLRPGLITKLKPVGKCGGAGTNTSRSGRHQSGALRKLEMHAIMRKSVAKTDKRRILLVCM
jgi:hypothetical protein